jgi:polyisoprenoid-binding protein YceI
VRRIALGVALTFLAVGCAAPPAAVPPPPTTGAPTTTPTATPRPAPPWSAVHLIADGESRAVVTVREQLAANTIENEAVLTADKVSGDIALLYDGSVWNGSKITVDLRSLRSDQSLRDKWVEKFGLQTEKYPTAEFVPQKVTGVKLPLPVAGQITLALEGVLTVREMWKRVTWDVVATRSGGRWEGIAKTVVTWSDFGIAKPQAIPQVVAVHDTIALEVRIGSTDAATRDCDAGRAREFDFWVGTWDISTPNFPDRRPVNTVTKVGCEVHEHFVGPFGNRSDYEGRSTARYVPALGKWQQQYIDNNNAAISYYNGGFEGDRFVLYLGDASGRSYGRSRLVWEQITAHSLKWHVELSADAGKTWTPTPGSLLYTRRA